MAPRKNAQSVQAEVSLVHLKNCLVNLPAPLVSLLVNINTVSNCPFFDTKNIDTNVHLSPYRMSSSNSAIETLPQATEPVPAPSNVLYL